MAKYNPQEVEAKWREKWEQEKEWEVDIEKAKRPYYNLMMFPYPSAEGLHVGNVYAFTGSDIHGRLRRMQGFDVFEPMGFDAFGIHSENFAIKQGSHPKEQTAKNISHFREQLKQMGALFDWSREVITSEPEYYKWTQWLFLQLYKAGLAYKAKAPVDWCPSCKTVLADEQVIQGRCERCETEVIQKKLEQWFFAITKYADRLLKNLDWIDWSERTKLAQRNWIGKSEGARLRFPVKCQMANVKCPPIEVFTTRPDTLFGATYMVLAPEHELVRQLKDSIENWEEVEQYIHQAAKKNELERTELAKEKTGVELKGVKAVNPASKEEVSVFIADYVLASYGTGAIMAVPAHDQRDWEFAKKYNLPVREVVQGGDTSGEAYTGEGVMVNSGQFNGTSSEEAKAKITETARGEQSVNYHLRDWLISRQRYWGPPIPIIYCKECGTVPVPEDQLPVLLPEVEDFRPQGTGKSPLASVPGFVNTECPQCGGRAERETDVSDTFLDSSWYFFRYPSTRSGSSQQAPFDKKLTKKWLPVDMYIGGQEHAVMHLLYARFITMALHDLRFADFEEPFKKFRVHGLIKKDGAKMSKSRGNVVNPDDFIARYGADSMRMYLMFTGPFSEGGDWSDKGIVGVSRFLNRLWEFAAKPDLAEPAKSGLAGPGLEALRHRTIKKVTEDLEGLRYNTAIAALMEFFNHASSFKFQVSRKDVETLLVLLAPFAPHITAELWELLQATGSVHDQPWPQYDESKIQEETVRLVLQVNGKPRDVVKVSSGISDAEAERMAMESEKVQKWLAGNKPHKVIVVPDKLVNVVV